MPSLTHMTFEIIKSKFGMIYLFTMVTFTPKIRSQAITYAIVIKKETGDGQLQYKIKTFYRLIVFLNMQLIKKDKRATNKAQNKVYSDIDD